MRWPWWLGVLALASGACTRDNPLFGADGPSPTGGTDASASASSSATGVPSTSAGEGSPETSASSVSDPTAEGTAEATAESAGSSSGGEVSRCCATTAMPGCADDPGLEACVCGKLPSCCELEWSAACRDIAIAECGAACAAPYDDCCVARPLGTCGDGGVVACVQALDGSCAPDTWTVDCATLAIKECGAGCLSGNDCCQVSNGAGCNDPDVVGCVCADEPRCCVQGWDFKCVAMAEVCNGGLCPVPAPECCTPHPGPGCTDPDLQGCVCGANPQCCEKGLFWDVACVAGTIACGGCGSDHSCEVVASAPGCNDPATMACVCVDQQMLECCTQGWTDACVAAALAC